ADHLLLLQGAVSGAGFVDATVVVGPMRLVKSDAELSLLQAAADGGDAAMRGAFEACRPGATELGGAGAGAAAVRLAGAEPEFAIGGGGPNGAYPHHHAGPRALALGDAVVIDIGSRRDNYFSDLTRMAFVGEPTERYLEVHSTVEAAVQAGLTAAKPGA